MKEERITIRNYTEKDKAFLLQAFDEFGDYLVKIDPLKNSIKTPGYAEYFVERSLSFIEKMKIGEYTSSPLLGDIKSPGKPFVKGFWMLTICPTPSYP